MQGPGATGPDARIRDLLARRGPLTGAQLKEALAAAPYALWRICSTDPALAQRTVGQRYVRLDEKLPEYGRLSPSILREFLTYTVVGTADAPEALGAAAGALAEHIRQVSRRKRLTARRIVTDILHDHLSRPEDADRFCVGLAGDIVYQMSHEVFRPERSTGVMVQGSDLDIVVLVDDGSEGLAESLDRLIYQRKYYYLRNPAFREELDYVVKPLATLRRQTAFATFGEMVACKVWAEAEWLTGSHDLFERAKQVLTEAGIDRRLAGIRDRAIAQRDLHRRRLLELPRAELSPEDLLLFYTADESAEFE